MKVTFDKETNKWSVTGLSRYQYKMIKLALWFLRGGDDSDDPCVMCEISNRDQRVLDSIRL